jgi:hypothetical protein
LASDELGHELETFIETPQNVQHQSSVLDGLAEVGKGIRHALHLAAVVIDGEGTLAKSAKLGVEEHGAGLAIVEELLFNPEPCCPGGEAVVLMDDVQEVGGDGVEEPREDDAVHARPHRIVGAGVVAEDVILQGEAAEDEEDVAAPLGVVGGLKIKNDGD